MCDKEKVPDLSGILADLYRFTTGEFTVISEMGGTIRQIYFVRDKIHIITDTGLWEFEPQEKTIRLITYL